MEYKNIFYIQVFSLLDCHYYCFVRYKLPNPESLYYNIFGNMMTHSGFWVAITNFEPGRKEDLKGKKDLGQISQTSKSFPKAN